MMEFYIQTLTSHCQLGRSDRGNDSLNKIAEQYIMEKGQGQQGNAAKLLEDSLLQVSCMFASSIPEFDRSWRPTFA